MSKPYSDDLRRRAVAAVESGVSRRQAAEDFSVGASSVIRWSEQYRQTGSVSARAMGGSRGSRIVDADREWLLARIAAQQDRPDVAEARARWRELQPTLDPTRLVFIDETWAKDNMAGLYGRCPRGQRLIGKIPLARWQTTTFVAALRHDRLTAPMMLEGPIDWEWFLAYVKQVLAPTLNRGDSRTLNSPSLVFEP